MMRMNAHIKTWLACLLLGATVVCVGGSAAKLALLPVGIVLAMPVIAWWKTGKFTYWPDILEKPHTTGSSFKKEKQYKQYEEPQKKAPTAKSYDLSDIPPPPKRNNSPLKSLPQGDGITPNPKKQQPHPDRCAILTKKTAPTATRVPRHPEMGSTQDLFVELNPFDDKALEVISVPEGEVFL